MRTIALRFSENFSPECGTINAHEELIAQNGYVWYGKLGSKISNTAAQDIMKNDEPRILLIHSGSYERYWAFVDRIQTETPPLQEIPDYYRELVSKFGVWFRVIRFQKAPKAILSQCFVASSEKPLSVASMHSMSPYFIIEYRNGSL